MKGLQRLVAITVAVVLMVASGVLAGTYGASADANCTITISGDWDSANWYESDGCYSGVGSPEVSDWDSQTPQGALTIDLSTSASDAYGSASSSILVNFPSSEPTIDIDSAAEVHDVPLTSDHWAIGYSEGGANWLTSGANQTVDVTIEYSYDLDLTQAHDGSGTYAKAIFYLFFCGPASNLLLDDDSEWVLDDSGGFLVKTVEIDVGTSTGIVTGSETWEDIAVNNGAYYSFWGQADATVYTPEPATIGLLALGGAAFLLRKRMLRKSA